MAVAKYWDEDTQQWTPILKGPKGDTGDTGPAGANSVVAADSPITYDDATQTVGWDDTAAVTVGSLTSAGLVEASGVDLGWGNNGEHPLMEVDENSSAVSGFSFTRSDENGNGDAALVFTTDGDPDAGTPWKAGMVDFMGAFGTTKIYSNIEGDGNAYTDPARAQLYIEAGQLTLRSFATHIGPPQLEDPGTISIEGDVTLDGDLILKSPDATEWIVSVDNAGNLTTTEVV